MNQKNIALTLYCPDIPILILWGNSCNIFLVIGGVNWTQPFEMLKSLRPSLPLTAFHCVGVSGPLQCAHGPRDVKCFLKALTNSFQKIIMVGGQKIFLGGEVGFNKIVLGFLLNQPPTANQNSTKVHLLTLPKNCNNFFFCFVVGAPGCRRSQWYGGGDNTIINRVMSKITLIPSLNMFLWPKLSQRIKKNHRGWEVPYQPPLKILARQGPPQCLKWPKMDVGVIIWGIFLHVNFLYNFWEFLHFFPDLKDTWGP